MNATNVCSYQVKACLADNKTFYLQTNPITHQQTKAQVELFREVLDKFVATSPEQIISTWPSAEKTRNGVFHYAVACNDLKNNIIKEWGEPKDSFWIYGGPSKPTETKLLIVRNKDIWCVKEVK